MVQFILQTAGEQVKVLPWVLGAIGLAAVIALAVLTYLEQKKKNNPPPSDGGATPPEGTAAPEPAAAPEPPAENAGDQDGGN